jgi:hypothetical protein
MIASRIQSGEPDARGPISYLIAAFLATPGHPHRHRIPSPEGENPGSVFRFRRQAWVTMTTGHAAACRHARATGPTAGGPSLADRPAYLAIPRTSSSAPADWSISARAGEPSTSSDDRQPGGKARLASSSTTASHALLAAWSSSGRGVPEKPEYGARSNRALSWTKRRCTSACRSRPSRAAHRTAAAEASVPSTPTTIRTRVVGISGQTFSLDGCSLTSSGRINGIPRRAAMSRPRLPMSLRSPRPGPSEPRLQPAGPSWEVITHARVIPPASGRELFMAMVSSLAATQSRGCSPV